MGSLVQIDALVTFPRHRKTCQNSVLFSIPWWIFHFGFGQLSWSTLWLLDRKFGTKIATSSLGKLQVDLDEDWNNDVNMTKNFILKALVGLSDVISYNWAKSITYTKKTNRLPLSNWVTNRLTDYQTRLADWQREKS